MTSEAKAKRNEDFRRRTQEASLRVIRLYRQLPARGEADVIGRQLLRSATSVAANYRASCRARSGAEYYAKLCICVEEADKTQFWLELIGQANILPALHLADLLEEYAAITAILTTARHLAKGSKDSH